MILAFHAGDDWCCQDATTKAKECPRNHGYKGIDTPILDSLIASGNIYIDGRSFVGIATKDMVHVHIGSFTDLSRLANTERYLRDFPNPSDW